jgi:malonyl-ACP decarboxylase
MESNFQFPTSNFQPQISAPVITGMGVLTAIGQGKEKFTQALLAGDAAFGYLQRPGREGTPPFLGAELPPLVTTSFQPEHNRLLRNASLSTQVALLAALEAWQDAQLTGINPERIGIVVGGSNVQQREHAALWKRQSANPQFINPSYGVSVWDTDLIGVLSQALQIRGEGFSVGNSSASGGMAIIQAARQIQSGQTDVVLVVGALFDISSWEGYGWRNLGALGSARFQDQPQAACRPFDQASDGFIYGEGCGILVLENAEHAQRRGARIYGHLLGWGSGLDGNRNSNPNQEGEARVMRAALAMAGLQAEQINYVNTHGTSSPLGDQTEVAALESVGLAHASLNATKSLTGHTLTAAGVVEAIATLVQMETGRLHPTRNLENPIAPDLHWVGANAIQANVDFALSNSFGFGGINTAIVLGRKNTETKL